MIDRTVLSFLIIDLDSGETRIFSKRVQKLIYELVKGGSTYRYVQNNFKHTQIV